MVGVGFGIADAAEDENDYSRGDVFFPSGEIDPCILTNELR